jgi:hypothetical protein
MDNTNTQVDVNALTADLTVFANDLNLKESARSQMSKEGIEKLDSINSPLVADNFIDSDDDTIAEIEAYADEQLSEFETNVEEEIRATESEDADIESKDVIEVVEGEDDLENLIK